MSHSANRKGGGPLFSMNGFPFSRLRDPSQSAAILMTRNSLPCSFGYCTRRQRYRSSTSPSLRSPMPRVLEHRLSFHESKSVVRLIATNFQFIAIQLWYTTVLHIHAMLNYKSTSRGACALRGMKATASSIDFPNCQVTSTILPTFQSTTCLRPCGPAGTRA